MNKKRYSCIIPCFNELPRVIGVLDIVTQIPEISEIVCVDDGSTDGSFEEIQKKFPNVTLIHHPVNQGKTQAIRTGLHDISEDSIILIDSDLLNLDKEEIRHAFHIFEQYNLDCLLLCGRPVNIVDSLTRILIRLPHCVTGNRIIKKPDLVAAITNPMLQRYQLEFAENVYLMKYNKRTAFINISAKNFWKIQKVGFFRGIDEDMHMWIQSLRYVGLISACQQIVFFARKEYR
jgi:glycosyltransferase involved in cell wall biosynthesis